MPITLPASVPYQGPIKLLPTKWNNVPPEGPMICPIEIGWNTQGGPAQCVSIDVQDPSSANRLTQIVHVSVDASEMSVACILWFPDTNETIPIANGSAFKTPVTTNLTNCYIWAKGAAALSTDVLRITFYNTMPPPTTLPSVFI